jgi:hypothetical protein
MTSVSPADLKHYYKWRHKMDWLLAPIHTRADLKKYLKTHAKSGSPLDALNPGARQRFLASLVFHQHGLGGFGAADLKYLPSVQIYKILSLFGAQSYTLQVTDGRFQSTDSRTERNSSQVSPTEKRFNGFVTYLDSIHHMPLHKRYRAMDREYEKLFSSVQKSDRLAKLSSVDLRLLLRAATRASHGSKAKHIPDARMDLDEMEQRHFASRYDYQAMYLALVQTGRFAAAHKFYQAHLDVGLTPFPSYRDKAQNTGKNTPTVLVVSTAKRELIRRPVNLDKPAQVLILTDPNCHFCVQFEQALQSRPNMRAVLAQHTTWVTPPGSELEFDTLQQWNKAHPRLRLNIMYSLQGWPMVKVLALPQFFFLRHGQVVKHHIGWWKNGFSALESGLTAIGLWRQAATKGDSRR